MLTLNYARKVAAVFAATFLCTLSSCKRGFELSETVTVDETTADEILLGATEGASWQILLREEGDDFTINKKSSPSSSSNEYTLNGDYSTRNGWMTFEIQSALPNTISETTFYGLQLAGSAVVIFPFEDSDQEWLPLVYTDGCPPSDIRGNAMMINRPAIATQDDVTWMSGFQYDTNADAFNFENGVALDTSFAPQGDFTQDTGNCTDGYVSRSAGDHYLGDHAVLLELDDATTDEDGYTRVLSLPEGEINVLSDIDDQDYVGMLRNFASPDDSYRVSANCSNGSCQIFRDTALNFVLTLDEANLNYNSTQGLITGELRDQINNLLPATPAVCMINPDLDNSSNTTKVIACTAQAPSDNRSTIQILLAASS